MSTYHGTRAASDSQGSPFEELSGGYYRDGDPTWTPNDPRHRDKPLIGRGPAPKERTIPAAPPHLGSAQIKALTVLAGADLTAPEVADRMGREHRSIHAVINSLEVKGLIARTGQRYVKGNLVKIRGATAAGRAALEAYQQGAKS